MQYAVSKALWERKMKTKKNHYVVLCRCSEQRIPISKGDGNGFASYSMRNFSRSSRKRRRPWRTSWSHGVWKIWVFLVGCIVVYMVATHEAPPSKPCRWLSGLCFGFLGFALGAKGLSLGFYAVWLTNHLRVLGFAFRPFSLLSVQWSSHLILCWSRNRGSKTQHFARTSISTFVENKEDLYTHLNLECSKTGNAQSFEAFATQIIISAWHSASLPTYVQLLCGRYWISSALRFQEVPNAFCEWSSWAITPQCWWNIYIYI